MNISSGVVSGIFAALAIQLAVQIGGNQVPIPENWRWISSLSITFLVEVSFAFSVYSSEKKCAEERTQLENDNAMIIKQRDEAWTQLAYRTQQTIQVADVARSIADQVVKSDGK